MGSLAAPPAVPVQATQEHCRHCFDVLLAHYSGEDPPAPGFPEAHWYATDLLSPSRVNPRALAGAATTGGSAHRSRVLPAGLTLVLSLGLTLRAASGPLYIASQCQFGPAGYTLAADSAIGARTGPVRDA